MSIRWNKEEETNLLKDISKGKSFDDLANKYNRSSNGLELRLKKIIYEFAIKNNSVSKMSKILNIDENKLIEYYYNYKEFLEKNGKETINVNLQCGGKNDIEKLKKKIKKLDSENKLLKKLINNKNIKSFIKKYNEKTSNKDINKIVEIMIEKNII